MRGWVAVVLVAASTLGCRDKVAPQNLAPGLVPRAGSSAAPLSSVRTAPERARARALTEFQRGFGLSTAGEAFVSDNVVSNETSLPQPAAVLSRLQGGVYIGVGPEQNFSLIAWSRPELAFLVDIRRDNALLHLLYKALFEQSISRLDFASGLLGRPYDSKLELPDSATIEALLRVLEGQMPQRTAFELCHRRLIERIQGYGLSLHPTDFERIRRFHEIFFEGQLELRFEMHESSGRIYPPLRQLWSLRSAEGIGTYLDSGVAFRRIQQMQREHRIVPLVGDVSKAEPLASLAQQLRARRQRLSLFYISNVEQYLLTTPRFAGWLGNLKRLPYDEHSLILRVYLDQGKPHRRQESGHRSTQVLHLLSPFLAKAETHPYRSYYALSMDDSLLAK